MLDGFAFLATRPNVRMTFVADICAMLLAQPRVLFPAAGAVIFGGGAKTVGALSAAAAVGGILAMFFSGRLGQVRRQGLAILVSIVGWGFAIAGFGAAMLAAGGVMSRGAALWLGLVAMAVAGASDSVSAVFRTTILQSATPDHLRGRLQGVFIVVVAGGPRLGEMAGGFLAERHRRGADGRRRRLRLRRSRSWCWPGCSRASCATTPATPRPEFPGVRRRCRHARLRLAQSVPEPSRRR